MNKPAPAALAMRGLTTITDNLPQGKGVNFAQDFAFIFRKELADRFIRSAAVPGFHQCPASSSCRSLPK
jgi:hypothetical protein